MLSPEVSPEVMGHRTAVPHSESVSNHVQITRDGFPTINGQSSTCTLSPIYTSFGGISGLERVAFSTTP